MKNVLLRIIGQIAPITVFVAVFFASALMVSGYRYNFKENTVVQTGVVDICSLQKRAHIFLDGQLYDENPCIKMIGMDLGKHTIEIREPGFIAWKKEVYVDPRMAKVFKDMILIPHPEFRTEETILENVKTSWVSPDESRLATVDPKLNVIRVISATKADDINIEAPGVVENLTWIDQNTLMVETKAGTSLVKLSTKEWSPLNEILLQPLEKKSDIYIEGNEVWLRGNHGAQLITRRAEPIEYADFFYGEGSIVIATAKKVEICDLQGENCQLISLKDKHTPIAHPVRSKKILLIRNGTLLQINLEGHFESLENTHEA